LPTSPTTPYGRSKLMCEEIIQDVVKANGLNAGIHSHLSHFSYIYCAISIQLEVTQVDSWGKRNEIDPII
jgi:hypothetical protein